MKYFSTSPLPCLVALREVAVTIGGKGRGLFKRKVTITLLPAVSRSITGCFATQNIGEVARRDGGVNKKTAALLCSFFSLLRRMNKETIFQPLSSGTTIPSVSPLYCQCSTREGRRLNTSYLTGKNHIIKGCRKTPSLPCPVAFRSISVIIIGDILYLLPCVLRNKI